ncbi:hypothetical protein M5689_007421 [Euphorbia peplus]|nr:hypothetical protein M5689_007421 [Euphorbia peplus]
MDDERDGNEILWTKLYGFRTYQLLPIGSATYTQVIWVAKNGNVVLLVDDWKLLLYNPEESLENGVNANEYITYMETLVSPNAS